MRVSLSLFALTAVVAVSLALTGPPEFPLVQPAFDNGALDGDFSISTDASIIFDPTGTRCVRNFSIPSFGDVGLWSSLYGNGFGAEAGVLVPGETAWRITWVEVGIPPLTSGDSNGVRRGNDSDCTAELCAMNSIGLNTNGTATYDWNSWNTTVTNNYSPAYNACLAMNTTEYSTIEGNWTTVWGEETANCADDQGIYGSYTYHNGTAQSYGYFWSYCPESGYSGGMKQHCSYNWVETDLSYGVGLLFQNTNYTYTDSWFNGNQMDAVMGSDHEVNTFMPGDLTFDINCDTYSYLRADFNALFDTYTSSSTSSSSTTSSSTSASTSASTTSAMGNMTSSMSTSMSMGGNTTMTTSMTSSMTSATTSSTTMAGTTTTSSTMTSSTTPTTSSSEMSPVDTTSDEDDNDNGAASVVPALFVVAATVAVAAF